MVWALKMDKVETWGTLEDGGSEFISLLVCISD